MKQITINYELYLDELRQAKVDGFNIVAELKPKLKDILTQLNSLNSQEQLFQCSVKLMDILKQLDNVEQR